MSEIFKTIAEYENYEVSNMGNVRNKTFNRLLKPGINRYGYNFVSLSKSGIKITKMVHRLVAEAFINNPDVKDCIDHIDNNKLNNNLSNLRFATTKENAQNKKVSINNTSGSKGVYWKKQTNKWGASIMIDGIQIHLGYFVNKEDAIQTRKIKANKVFGIFTNSCESM